MIYVMYHYHTKFIKKSYNGSSEAIEHFGKYSKL